MYLLCFLLIQVTFAQPPGNSCDAGYQALHQKLKLKSDRELLNMVYNLYELTESSSSGSSSNTNASLIIPNKLDAAYSSNKKKVKNAFKHHKNEQNVILSIDEKIDLVSSFYTDAAFQKVTDAWLECIRVSNGIPYSTITQNTKSEVLVTFVLPYSQYSNKRVKVKSISSSSNLVFSPEGSQIQEGSVVNYDNNNYTLMFKRKEGNTDIGSVMIMLSKGTIAPIHIPVAGATYERRMVKETLTIKTRTDVSSNWFKFQLPDGSEQVITFKNANGSHYKLILEDIKTNIKNKNVTIKSVEYIPKTGGIRDYASRGVGVEPNNTLNLDIYVHTGEKQMTGELKVDYEVKRLVCVENCP